MGRINRDDAIVADLLAWGAGSLRELPWRATRDPWAILVSEVMLQQTQVARVLEKYPPFMERFPTVGDMADATLADALVLWSGLGYPRRCRNLHAAAQAITSRHDGRVPDTLEELLALPGVGRYTARAVLCFAHGRAVGVVDTNVSRVLSRLDGTSMTTATLQERADRLVPADSAWEWNQVIMDFGARQCVARSPECGECALRARCRWKGNGADPAAGSAGASRPQPRFAGSDREARGRAMKAVMGGAIGPDELVGAMELDHDRDRANRLIEDLLAEGLLSRGDGVIGLG